MTQIPEGVEALEAPRPASGRQTNKDDQGKSQSQLIWARFRKNKVAITAIVVLVLVLLLGYTSIGFLGIPGWWKYSYTELNPQINAGKPTLSVVPGFLGGKGFRIGEHPFGQDRIGKDYFAMTMKGIQNSFIVMVVITGLATLIGVIIGSISGYYRGKIDSVLMRFTDVVIVIPVVVLGAVVGQIANSKFGGLGVLGLAIVLGLVAWTGMARLLRAEFFSLREREFVDAARLAGASDRRVIFKHILPNAIGVVIVTATLTAAAAILLETALSFLGFGIHAPDVSLGLLISLNQSAFAARPWLFWWPGLFIVVIALCVNFLGDGLRDAFDPRQRRFRPSKTKEMEPETEAA